MYLGPLDFKRMPRLVRRAYYVWVGQGQRSKRHYSSREFIGWYLNAWKKRNPKRGRWDVARKDHSKGYSFDNIELQPVLENMRERNARCGNPSKSAREVRVFIRRTNRVEISVWGTIEEASAYAGVDRKTAYNYLNGHTKTPGKYGPKVPQVWFEWA